MYNALKRHASAKSFIRVPIGVFLLALLILPVFRSGEYVFERWITSQEYWFEYESITPVSAEFKRGQTIEFESIIEYKRDGMTIRWFDYLFCEGPGFSRKLQTQVWPENSPEPKLKGRTDEDQFLTEDGNLPSWAYTQEPIPELATHCRLHALAVGYTPRYGHPKPYYYVGPWFPVNR